MIRRQDNLLLIPQKENSGKAKFSVQVIKKHRLVFFNSFEFIDNTFTKIQWCVIMLQWCDLQEKYNVERLSSAQTHEPLPNTKHLLYICRLSSICSTSSIWYVFIAKSALFINV